MYVLEASAPPAPTPGTGRIVRVNPDGHGRVVIAEGLFFPTAMTMGPDGKTCYVSNVGFGAPPKGMGEILKIEAAGLTFASVGAAASYRGVRRACRIAGRAPSVTCNRRQGPYTARVPGGDRFRRGSRNSMCMPRCRIPR